MSDKEPRCHCLLLFHRFNVFGTESVLFRVRVYQLYTRVGGVFSSSFILIFLCSSHKFGLGKPQSKCIVVSLVVLYILRHTLLTCVISYPYSDPK